MARPGDGDRECPLTCSCPFSRSSSRCAALLLLLLFPFHFRLLAGRLGFGGRLGEVDLGFGGSILLLDLVLTSLHPSIWRRGRAGSAGSRCHRAAEEPMKASPSSSSSTSWWREACLLHDLAAWGAAAAWDLAVGELAARASSRVPESAAAPHRRQRPCSNNMEKVVVTTVACRGRPCSSPAAPGCSLGPRRPESPASPVHRPVAHAAWRSSAPSRLQRRAAPREYPASGAGSGSPRCGPYLALCERGWGPARLRVPRSTRWRSVGRGPGQRLQRRSMHRRGRRRCSTTMSTLEEACDGVHIGFFSATAAPLAPKRCCGCSAPATARTKPEKLGLRGPARNFHHFRRPQAIVPPMDHMNKPAILVDRPQD
ncbi:hypothetical protein BS78_05G178300 [Paspalum vaginatum]|nr:hypothetical protein BS78_05G178300 [Paspalum vaginatum]